MIDMKVAIGAANYGLDSSVSEIFGRSSAFIFVDLEDGEIKEISIIENPVKNESGAGNNSAQIMVDNKVEILISGKLGPTAFHILKRAGIKVYKGVNGNVERNLKRFNQGKLEEITTLSGGFPV